MQLFQQNKNKLNSLKEKPFKLERDIQKLLEGNLNQISGYQFIKSEFIIKNNRIDTPKKLYIAFKKDKNLADIHIQQKGLKMWINLHKGDLDDPKKITNDVSHKGHWGNGDYEITVSDTLNLEYIMSLVKQALS